MRLAGFFCLEGFSLKRKWMLVPLLRDAGASISYQLVASTRFLVVGADATDLDRVERAKQTARACGVPVISEEELLRMISAPASASQGRRVSIQPPCKEANKKEKEPDQNSEPIDALGLSTWSDGTSSPPRVKAKIGIEASVARDMKDKAQHGKGIDKEDEEEADILGLFDDVPSVLLRAASTKKAPAPRGKAASEEASIFAKLMREREEEERVEQARLKAERVEQERMEEERIEYERQERERRDAEEREMQALRDAEPPGSPRATSYFHCAVSAHEWNASRAAPLCDAMVESEAMSLGLPAETSDLDADMMEVWWAPAQTATLLTTTHSHGVSQSAAMCVDESTGESCVLQSSGIAGASFEETRAADVALRMQIRNAASVHPGLRRSWRVRERSVSAAFDQSGRVLGVPNVIGVACASEYRLTLDSEGRVFARGGGAHNRLGLGHNRRTRQDSVVVALGGAIIVQVSCGEWHSAALSAEGTVYTWGDNSRGQLGHSTNSDSHECAAALVPLPTRIVYVACGSAHTMAVTAAGAVYAWGANEAGQLGLGHANDQQVPHLVALPATLYVRSVAAGSRHTLLLSTSGVVYATGANQAGQLGLGVGASRTSYEEVKGALKDKRVVSLAAGSAHSAAVADSELYVWGKGEEGQLGGPLECAWPSLMASLSDPVRLVACGTAHTAVLLTNGAISLLGPNNAPLRTLPALRADALIAGGESTVLMCYGAAAVCLQYSRLGDVPALRLSMDSVLTARDAQGRSPLHCASLDNHPDMVRLLLEHVPQLLSAQDGAGNSAVHLAAMAGATQSLEVLLKHKDIGLDLIDLVNNDGDAALLMAVRESHSGCVVQLTQACADKRAKDSQGRTALHLAVETGQHWLVRYLVRHAAPLNATDAMGRTPTDALDFAETAELKQLATHNDLFISYAHADIEAARRVKQALERHGLRCWMDEWRLEAGSDWRNDIGQGILAASALVFLASPTSLTSDWCAKELQLATQHGRLIVPCWLVRTSVSDTSVVRAFVRSHNFVDLTAAPGAAFFLAASQLARKCHGIVKMVERGYIAPPRPMPEDSGDDHRKGLRYCWVSYAKGDRTFASTLRSQLSDAGVFFCRLARHATAPAERPEETDEAALTGASAVLFLVSKLTLLSEAQTAHAIQAAREGKRLYVVVLHRQSLTALSASVRDALSRAARFYHGDEAMEALRQLAYALSLAEKESVLQAERDAARAKHVQVLAAMHENEKRLQRLRQSYAVEHLVK